MEKSVVIIGAGLGGLFTGAILAKEGLKVTILEKNAIIGGGLQSFRRFGETFDTGMHVIAGMKKGGNIYRICDYLGIMDKVQLEHMGPDTIDSLYFAEDKTHYRIAEGSDKFIEVLAGMFPHQKENLKNYVDAINNVVNEIDMHFLRPASDSIMIHSEDFLMPADKFIAKYITDRKLRGVVAYMNPFYSGKKDTTATYIHALIMVLYLSGPSRFAGGSILFANALKECIEKYGGRVLSGEGAKSIHTKDRVITGITSSSGRYYVADYYISAIHPSTLFTLFEEPSSLPKAYRDRVDSIPNSYSAFTLNIKLKPNTFKHIKHTSYYMAGYDDMWEFHNPSKQWPLGFLYITPPNLDQGEYATKMIITAPMLWENVKTWENTSVGKRGEDYEAWKANCAEILISKMEEIFPDFRSCIEAVNSASPLTIRDFYGAKEGAMAGYVRDCNDMVRAQVPVVTKIKNLLLTGQNCNIHGFCGVPLTAINTCEAILGRNYILNRLNNV